MNIEKIIVIVISMILLTGCSGLKVLPESDSVEGKIVVSKHSKKEGWHPYYALYLIKNKKLEMIQNSEMKGDIQSPHWTVDGKRIAFYSDNNWLQEERKKTKGIYIIDHDGNNLNYIKNGFIVIFSFLPNGEEMIYYQYSYEKSEQEFYILNINNREVKRLEKEKNIDYEKNSFWPNVDGSRISPDGKKKLWYKEVPDNAGRKTELYITYLDTEKTEIAAKGSKFIENVKGIWSSDSKKIMYLQESIMDWQKIRLYNLETKETIDIIKIKPREITGFDWWTSPTN